MFDKHLIKIIDVVRQNATGSNMNRYLHFVICKIVLTATLKVPISYDENDWNWKLKNKKKLRNQGNPISKTTIIICYVKEYITIEFQSPQRALCSTMLCLAHHAPRCYLPSRRTWKSRSARASRTGALKGPPCNPPEESKPVQACGLYYTDIKNRISSASVWTYLFEKVKVIFFEAILRQVSKNSLRNWKM